MCKEYGKETWEEMIDAFLIMARRQGVLFLCFYEFECLSFRDLVQFFFNDLMRSAVHPLQARFPFLDENVIKTLLDIPLWEIAKLDEPVGKGDKKILREVCT